MGHHSKEKALQLRKHDPGQLRYQREGPKLPARGRAKGSAAYHNRFRTACNLKMLSAFELLLCIVPGYCLLSLTILHLRIGHKMDKQFCSIVFCLFVCFNSQSNDNPRLDVIDPCHWGLPWALDPGIDNLLLQTLSTLSLHMLLCISAFILDPNEPLNDFC